jgi:hypothetical protein
MSCAWNNYCKAVNDKCKAIETMAGIGDFLKSNENDPVLEMLDFMLKKTAIYQHLDMLIFERDNYITLIGEDMERNGDDWIIYMAGTLQDKNMFEWLRVYMRIPFELKEKWKKQIRKNDYEYEKRAGREV